MARGERNARRDDRRPMVDPWFGPESATMAAGYSQPSGIDPTGYSIEDPSVDSRVEGEFGSDVTAPLGGPLLGRISTASYGDDTDHAVPGGALGEAGAGWRSDDFRMPSGEWIGGGHAERRVALDYQGVVPPHTLVGMQTGLERVPSADGPDEYTGRDAPRRNLSDREVYDDLYGPGREFGSKRGREDDGLGVNDRADRGGDRQGRRLVDAGREDPGYS